MNEGDAIPLLILLTGTLTVLAVVCRWLLERVSVPAIVGYFLLGFGLRLADPGREYLDHDISMGIDFLAQLGVAALLFRVGLESNLTGLMHQLRRAQPIWLANIVVSGAFGWVAARYVLGFPMVPSLFVTVALTATSVGVSTIVWRDAGALQSPEGELLLDVAELDDISAVCLMAALFAVVPVLKGDADTAVLRLVGEALGVLIVQLLLFGAACLLFSLFLEERMTRFFRQAEPMPVPMLTMVGSALAIAGLAGLLGFSVAMGAFFAGLAYSRDPEAVKMETPYEVLYDLFAPFFFIGIGFHIDPFALTTGAVVGGVLLVAAVLGKLLANALPGLPALGAAGAVLLGVSMVPRAEIALVVMQQGRARGDWAVPPEAYAGMVIVSAVTCLLSPLVLKPMLRKHTG